MIQDGPGMLRQVASIVYLQTPAWGGGGGWNAMREVSAYVTVLESADKLALLVRGLDNGD